MKRILLIVIAAFAASSSVCAQQFDNYSFEDWSTETLFEEPIVPVDIVTSNPHSYFTSGYGNVESRTNTDSLGNFAHLESTTDSVMGFIIIGEIDGELDDPLNLEFSGGVEVNPGGAAGTSPDILYIDMNYDCEPTDSVYVVIGAKNNGNMTAVTISKLSGSSGGWVTEAFDINYFLAVPGYDGADSLVIAVTSENPELTINPGNMVEIDNIRYVDASGTMVRFTWGDFENWDATEVTDPDGWFTSNPYTEEVSVSENIGESTHGTSSLKIVTQNYVNDEEHGFVLMGSFESDTSGVIEGVPVDSLPLSLEFDYQYTSGGNGEDSAFIAYGGYTSTIAEGRTIVVGASVILEETTGGGFTHYTMDISSSGETPDSVYLFMMSSYSSDDDSVHVPQLESELIIDNLKVNYAVVTSTLSAVDVDGGVFPNPSAGEINVSATVSAVNVYDANGRFVQSYTNQGASINTGLAPGMYYYQLESESVVDGSLHKLLIH
jgi:hypothetical protein